MITISSAIGRRPYNEDRIMWADAPGGVLLGVFDGHGGEFVADLLAHQMPKMWSAIDGDAYEKSLRHVFAMAHSVTKEYKEGSTASVAFIPADVSVAYVAILGDSPVIVDKADGSLFVGPEHNVRSNPEERSAAINRGGIYSMGYIWDDMGDLGAGLQMSRAFGDAPLRRILSEEPEIFKVPLGRFLLLATDGLLDPTHKKHGPARAIVDQIFAGANADQLVQHAISMPTDDNVTAILWRRE